MIEFAIAAAGIILIAVSYFEVYKVKHITVAYLDPFGQMRGYAFDYAYRIEENWLNIKTFEQYIAKKKKLQQVRIMQLQVKTKWKLRRA